MPFSHSKVFNMKTSSPQTNKRASNADVAVESEGDHPNEMGVLDGAAIGVGMVGGAASGMAVGLAAGPVGVVAGAVIGAVAGGMAGRGMGLLLDPTTDDDEFRKEFPNRPYVKQGQVFEEYAPFYLFGAKLEAAHVGRAFSDVEPQAKTEYEKSGDIASTPWNAARPAIADGFERSSYLRKVRTDRRES